MRDLEYVMNAMENKEIKQIWSDRLGVLLRATFTPSQVAVLEQFMVFRLPTKGEIDEIKERLGIE